MVKKNATYERITEGKSMIRNREQIQRHDSLQRICPLRSQLGKGLYVISLVLTTASPLQSFPEISTWLPTSLVARQEEKSSTEYRVGPRAVIDVTIPRGSVKIETWNKPFVMVNLTKNARTPEELAATGIRVEHSELKLTLKGEQSPQTLLHLSLIVPATATVTISTDIGPITIVSAPRNVTARTKSGNIEATTHTDGSINTHTENGNITITCEGFSSSSSLFVTAPDGAILVKVPSTTKARLNARSDRGTVKSQLPITIDSFTTKVGKNTWRELQRNIKGTIGDGDAVAPITLSAHGNIVIMEQKP
jgi:hypothetical protein